MLCLRWQFAEHLLLPLELQLREGGDLGLLRTLLYLQGIGRSLGLIYSASVPLKSTESTHPGLNSKSLEDISFVPF